MALAKTDFLARGIVIVDIKKPDGQLLMPPTRDTVIQEHDILIVMGKASLVEKLIAEI